MKAGTDGRFTRLLGTGATGPEFQMPIDGLILTGSGYKLWDFMLSRDETNTANKHWHLKVSLMRLPKVHLQ
jgi:hypothetical protein